MIFVHFIVISFSPAGTMILSIIVYWDRLATPLNSEATLSDQGLIRFQPLFLYLSFQAVHTPIKAPRKFVEMYLNVDDARRRTYLGMLEAGSTHLCVW